MPMSPYHTRMKVKTAGTAGFSLLFIYYEYRLFRPSNLIQTINAYAVGQAFHVVNSCFYLIALILT